MVDQSDPYGELTDEQWLAALAGKPYPQASSETNQLARHIRAALLAEARDSIADVHVVDEVRKQRMIRQLQAEGFLSERIEPEPENSDDAGIRRRAVGEIRFSRSNRDQSAASYSMPRESSLQSALKAPAEPNRSRAKWAAAATVLIAFGAAFHISGSNWSNQGITRGNSAVAASDPQKLADEIFTALDTAKADPEMYVSCNGTVEISASATPQAIDAVLEGQWRIFPDVQNERLSIILSPDRHNTCGLAGKIRDRAHQFVKNITWLVRRWT